jgi:thiol-disulfide isomerase/thioredoxin
MFLVLIALVAINACDDSEPKVEINIQADKQSIIADGTDKLTFSVISEDGDDYTAESVFIVANEEIAGSSFTSSVAGAFTCYAEYKSSKSNSVVVEVKELPIFKKNILIENYTAVWCGYCPRIHDAIIDGIDTDTEERVIPIALHGDSDPYYFSNISSLMGQFNVSGYPTAMIDRNYSWPYPEVYGGLSKAMNNNAALGIALVSEINGINIDVDVKIKFGKDFTQAFKVVVCLVENGLIHDQTNYYDDGRGDPIKDYEHNNVLRKYGTDLYGDVIPSDQVVKDNEYVKSITFDASNYNPSNCEIIAFVTNGYEVVNVQIVNADGTKDYELLD